MSDPRDISFLKTDDQEDMISLRQEQQDYIRYHTGKHVRNKDRSIHTSVSPNEGLEERPEHPLFLFRQDLDGYDPSVAPLPPLGSPERTEYENQLRLEHQKKLQKQQELQERLGLMAPRPR